MIIILKYIESPYHIPGNEIKIDTSIKNGDNVVMWCDGTETMGVISDVSLSSDGSELVLSVPESGTKFSVKFTGYSYPIKTGNFDIEEIKTKLQQFVEDTKNTLMNMLSKVKR